MLRKHLLFILGMIAVNLAALVMPCGSAGAMEDGIIAVVDDEVITAKDYQDYMRGLYSQLRIEGRSDAQIKEIMGEYQSRGIEQLIEDRLILAEANRQGMVIRSQSIEERLTEIKKRYASSQEFIAEINKEGVTISDIRKKIEDQFKARYLVNKDVRDKIMVNPQEVTGYYAANKDQYRRQARVYLESISVKADPRGDEEAQKKIEAAMARLKSGDDFKDVAKVYSELPDIGEIPEDSLSPQFKAATAVMQAGEISGIIATADGFYILRLSGRTAPMEPSLAELKDSIYQKLFELKFKSAFDAWIGKLRKKSYVDIKK